jgi:hypothetical protein
MRTAMRPRYYCDHCNKGSGSPSAMKRHERGCTLNPVRECGMCRLAISVGWMRQPAPPRDDLVAIMDEHGFAAMCDAADNCPACILAAVRTKNRMSDKTGPSIAGPEDGREKWQYSQAKAEFWDNYRQDESERSYQGH